MKNPNPLNNGKGGKPPTIISASLTEEDVQNLDVVRAHVKSLTGSEQVTAAVRFALRESAKKHPRPR